MTNNKVFLQIPIQLLRGLMQSPSKRIDAINDMIKFAIFKTFQNFTKTGIDFEETLPKVYDFLGMENEGGIKAMKKSCLKGSDIACKIKTKSYFFISKNKLFDLRDEKFSYDYYVAITMYLALGSIQGKQSYWKATNLFLLSRMDGRDKTVSGIDKLSAAVRKIATRRKLDKYKSMLEEFFGVSFFGFRMRGFYFSTKLEKKDLIKTISEPPKKKRRTEIKIRKSDKETLIEMFKNDDLQPLEKEQVAKLLYNISKCTTQQMYNVCTT